MGLRFCTWGQNMDKWYCWTQFAVPLRHFRDKKWMVYERLCCMFHCEKQEIPHVRNWAQQKQSCPDGGSGCSQWIKLGTEWKYDTGAHRVLFNSHWNSCVRCGWSEGTDVLLLQDWHGYWVCERTHGFRDAVGAIDCLLSSAGGYHLEQGWTLSIFYEVCFLLLDLGVHSLVGWDFGSKVCF